MTEQMTHTRYMYVTEHLDIELVDALKVFLGSTWNACLQKTDI